MFYFFILKEISFQNVQRLMTFTKLITRFLFKQSTKKFQSVQKNIGPSKTQNILGRSFLRMAH